MKAHTGSLINAVVLILCSAWGYWATDLKSLTALIPMAFGIALLACYPGVKSENKIVAHIAAVLTLVILIALYMPTSFALNSEDLGRIVRSALMVVTTLAALIFFIKSFRDARRAREG